MRIPKIIKDYKIIKKISSGGFAVVYLGENIHTHTHVAIKRDEYNHRTIQELEILKRITKKCHKNIICFFDYYVDDRNYTSSTVFYDDGEDEKYDVPMGKDIIYIVMELANGNDLFQYMIDHPNLDEKRKFDIIYQLVETISYLHDQGISHRDLKPENIIYDGKNIKLIDFGFGCNFVDIEPVCAPDEVAGTLHFMAPEVLNKNVKDWQKADIWSLGATIYEIATNSPLVPNTIQVSSNIKNIIVKRKFKLKKIDIPVIDEIVKQCLRANYSDRPFAREILDMLNKNRRQSKSENKRLSEKVPEKTKISFANNIREYLIYTVIRLARLGVDEKITTQIQKMLSGNFPDVQENILNCINDNTQRELGYGNIIIVNDAKNIDSHQFSVDMEKIDKKMKINRILIDDQNIDHRKYHYIPNYSNKMRKTRKIIDKYKKNDIIIVDKHSSFDTINIDVNTLIKILNTRDINFSHGYIFAGILLGIF